jgi:hypothetical protein
MDVQNNEITGTKIPMGKKVYLELSISDDQLSRSHDQGGRKLPPQKLMCGSF